MAKNILIPLDGSEFGEQALRYGREVALATSATVHLVKVHFTPAPVIQPEGYAYFAASVDKEFRETETKGLEEAAADLGVHGLRVRTALLAGSVAEALKQYIADEHIDLVVMTTHGRGGLSRAWLGSVADSLVRSVTVPLVLLRPRNLQPQASSFHYPPRHVLIPLDGSELSERILDQVLSIGAVAPKLTLMQVVPPPVEIPAAESIVAFQDLETDVKRIRESTLEYLERVADRLRQRGIVVDTRVVVQSQTAMGILEQALDCGCDMIAMATHGRTGWARVALGSVADKVVRSTSVPLLLQKPDTEIVAGLETAAPVGATLSF